VVWSSGILSALVTNDAVCVLGAPLVVRLIRRYRLPPLPFVLALATSANTGSVATLVGNPQNMLCAQLGALSYREHLVLMGPVALLSLLLNHGLLLLMFRGALSEPLGSPSETVGGDARLDAAAERRSLFTLAVICATAIFYVFGGNLAWTAAAGVVLLMLVHRRDTRELWPRIDWALLLFFSGLFVVVAGLMKSGVPEALFARFPLVPAAAAQVEAGALSFSESLRLSSIFLVGSNVVSNVPFILVVEREMASLPNPKMAWELLAMASTFAGNLTLLGSAANIIVAEAAQDVGGIPFLQHLRVGLPLTLLTTLLGALWLAFVGAALG
jgi:Na+/H+ antiporter NhaD/arsenite permease-like protein